jgi:hypothetical protein
MEQAKCPECGAVLPRDGQCVHCLLRLGIGEPSPVEPAPSAKTVSETFQTQALGPVPQGTIQTAVVSENARQFDALAPLSMPEPDRTSPSTERPSAWARVRALGKTAETDAELAHLTKAFEALAGKHFLPIYAYLRGLGLSPEETVNTFDDAVGIASVWLLPPEPLDERRFRPWLLAALGRHFNKGFSRFTRIGRPQEPTIPWGVVQLEARLAPALAGQPSPAQLYAETWAWDLEVAAWGSLKEEWQTLAGPCSVEMLFGFRRGEPLADEWEELARSLERSVGETRMFLGRIQRRFRDLLRLEVADTVDGPEAEVMEWQELFPDLAAYG